MAKGKGSKGKSVPQRHLHARLSYLHQASSYLALAGRGQMPNLDEDVGDQNAPSEQIVPRKDHSYSQSRHMLSQLRAISLKSQIRLSPAVKHTLCKRCNSLLVAGKTSTASIINGSTGGRKPQADVLVVKCEYCRTLKRFPVGQPRLLPKGGVDHGKDHQQKDA